MTKSQHKIDPELSFQQHVIEAAKKDAAIESVYALRDQSKQVKGLQIMTPGAIGNWLRAGFNAYKKEYPLHGDLTRHMNDAFWRSYVDGTIERSFELMDSNPYQWVRYAPKGTVPKVDQFLTQLLPVNHRWHVNFDDVRRCEAYVEFVLKVTNESGQAALPQRTFVYRVKNYLFAGLTDKQMYVWRPKIIDRLNHVQTFTKCQYLDGDDPRMNLHDGITTNTVLEQSKTLAEELLQRCDYDEAYGKTFVDEDMFEYVLDHLKLDDGAKLTLSIEQTQIVHALLENRVSILFGSAGTGKSTLLKAVYQYLTLEGVSVECAAYSGKAAFNLRKMLKTTHSQTALSMTNGAKSDLQFNYLIIDEISMMPEWLLMQLLVEKCNDDTHIILIGDDAQLPAVKAIGLTTSLLQYLHSDANKIPYYQLTHVYRQAGSSALLDAATKIRKFDANLDLHPKDDTLRYEHIDSPQQVVDHYQKALQQHDANDVMLLTSKRISEDGSLALNQKIQKVVQHNNLDFLTYYGQRYYLHDRILVIKNQYRTLEVGPDDDGDDQIDVMNGFLGEIVAIQNEEPYKHKDAKGRITIIDHSYVLVRFTGMSDPLDGSDCTQYVRFYIDVPSGYDHDGPQPGSLNNIELGYAMTVHKSQGSTIPFVMYYLPENSLMRLTRQALYTAFTRGKTLQVLTTCQIKPQFLIRSILNDAYDGTNSLLGAQLFKLSRTDFKSLPPVLQVNQF